MVTFRLLILLMVSASSKLWGADALRCLSCSYTAGDDNTCIYHPEQVSHNVTECFGPNGACCSITRQEYTENPGLVVSFARVCMRMKCPGDDFQKVADPFNTVYMTFCDDPTCNTGEGNKPLSNVGSDEKVICCIHGSGGNPTTTLSWALLLTVAVAHVMNREEVYGW